MNWNPKYAAGTIIRKKDINNPDHFTGELYKIAGYNIEENVYIIDSINSILRIYGPKFDMNEHEYALYSPEQNNGV